MKLAIYLLLLIAPFQNTPKPVRVLAFFTAKEDLAHISFVHEANKWFAAHATSEHYSYDSTSDWSRLNDEELKQTDIVIFLDTRPEDPQQRLAFERYMKNGGAWIGFHFAAFALDSSAVPEDWHWYHQEFLGSGQYRSNTWRPTSATLKSTPFGRKTLAAKDTFHTAPNEWYRWQNDLTKNPDIQIIAFIDRSSFPLGTGPKQHEIWHSGFYPVVWTNRNYRMVYFNMGHNDMDYEHGTNRQLSSSFESSDQNRLLLSSLRWLAHQKRQQKTHGNTS
jgi:uncharacterized protein